MIKEAEMFARGAHAGQKHGDRPYHAHLNDVWQVLVRWRQDSELMGCAAWLHDTIEDTPVTYQDLKNLFGLEVAELVWAVTDEMGRNRAERKDKTHPKIFASERATILKLADLTANVERSCKDSDKLRQMYSKEWPEMKVEFEEALYKHGVEGAQAALAHLQELIDAA